MNSPSKPGLLLINLGTPASLDLKDIKAYLGEFLMDPSVIDIPWPLRAALVHGIILRSRPPKTREAYQQVWMAKGSPLMVLSRDLQAAVQSELPKWKIALGMRYGSPSIESAANELSDCDHVTILPLYPQYALSSTQTALDKLPDFHCPVTIIRDFYNHPLFIEALQNVIRDSGALSRTDHLLLSYHGLPERHIRKTDLSNDGKPHCLNSVSCCDSICAANADCYKAQSYETSRLLTRSLGIPPNKTSVAFQSRLGVSKWITPYTDEVLTQLPMKGVKRLAVACPSFVTDCLETLEEIAIRAKESFLTAGGEHFEYVPCLNSHPSWIRAVTAMANTK